MIRVLVPVKPFGVAKARLAGRLDSHQRSRLGRAVALNTMTVLREADVDAAILTADADVMAWSVDHGLPFVQEPGRGGLSGACRHGVATAIEGWAVLHADLPLLSHSDVAALLEHDGSVLAPSHDGGTNAIVGAGPFEFSYGPGSFHRHLAALGEASIVMRIGLAIDLDDPLDLEVIRRHERGRWIEPYLV